MMMYRGDGSVEQFGHTCRPIASGKFNDHEAAAVDPAVLRVNVRSVKALSHCVAAPRLTAIPVIRSVDVRTRKIFSHS